MDYSKMQERKFETIEYGTISGIEVHDWGYINNIAVRNGWMNSKLVYIGTFRVDDCDDVFALFRDTEYNKNFYLAI